MGRPRKKPAGMWKRRETYYARFSANGRSIRERLSTDFDTACQLLNELKARADRGDFGLVDNDFIWEKLKVEFLKWKEQTTRRPGEYARALRRFEEYSAVRSVKLIDAEYVDGYRKWRLAHTTARKEGVKGHPVTPRTVNKEVSILSHMLNMGVERRRIGSNPIAKVKPLRHDSPSKCRRSLSLAEVEAIFENSPPSLRPVRRTFMATGLRKRELINLRFENVDFEQRTLTVLAATAKNHKRRDIPLDDETLAMIAALRDAAKDRRPVAGRTPAATERQRANFSREHVFVAQANTPLANNLLTRFYSVCRRAGIEGAHERGSVDLHSLRVTFTTLSLEGGAKPKNVQAILGHSTLALTMGVYAKATEGGKRDAVAALPFVAKVSAPAHAVAFSVSEAHTTRTSNRGETEDLAEIRVAR